MLGPALASCPRALALWAALAGLAAHAHPFPHAFEGYPKAPPTVDPGPDAALLRIRIIDAKTRQPASGVVSVNRGDQEPEHDPYRKFGLRQSANRQKGPIRLRDLPYYFFTDGRFEVRVPPGGTSIHVSKGYEYRPSELTVAARARETLDLEVPLERSIDMAAHGWYSGDTHIHMERTGDNDDMLLAVTSAKDVRYAFLLAANSRGYDAGGPRYETFPQKKGLGDKSVVRRGPYHISSGQEYIGVGLGHVTIALPDQHVPANGPVDITTRGPSLALIADQAHALRGFIGLNHGGYENQEADALILAGKMDFLELLQFGAYRSLGLSGWYDFLNIGYRIAIVGASDFPPTRELSSEMTYVWSEAEPTPRSYVEGIRAGRSFATSGPMLLLSVDGKKPGEIIRHPAGAEQRLTVDVRVHSAIYPARYVEVIANGAVVERRFDPNGRSEWSLRHVLPIRGSTWVAARAYSDAGTDAHTNPVYVYLGNQHPFDADSARRIIARLEGSIATITLADVTARLRELQAEVQSLIKDRRSKLPLPRLEP